jgi:hypothetical protein
MRRTERSLTLALSQHHQSFGRITAAETVQNLQKSFPRFLSVQGMCFLILQVGVLVQILTNVPVVQHKSFFKLSPLSL